MISLDLQPSFEIDKIIVDKNTICSYSIVLVIFYHYWSQILLFEQYFENKRKSLVAPCPVILSLTSSATYSSPPIS